MVAEGVETEVSRKRVLVVDDDRGVCECLADFFKAKGFTVSSAFSGEQALDYVSEGAPQVVVLDIMLPGISGLEVLRRVKDVWPDSKVIMITGLTQPELQVQARQYGACGYVTKPFDFSDETWAPALSP